MRFSFFRRHQSPILTAFAFLLDAQLHSPRLGDFRLAAEGGWMTVLETDIALMCFTTRALAFLATARVVSTTDFHALGVVRPESVCILPGLLCSLCRSVSWSISFFFNFGYIGHQMLAHDARAVEGETASGEVLVDGGGNLAVGV